jgi:DNA primase small subunit
MAGVSTEELHRYYLQRFPLEDIRAWLQYKDPTTGIPQEREDCRECAFWFDDTKFRRWSTIDQMERLRALECDLPPERMEIGPVYTYPVSRHTTIPSPEFRPAHRELVFDLDADDFKDIKSCCGPSEICERCWVYMHCALDCLYDVLTNNLGFRHVLPVFSGRRGIHIWVCDKRARELDKKVREQIVRYLNLNELVSSVAWSTTTNPGHFPLAVQMIQKCDGYFAKVIEAQAIFTAEALKAKVKGIVGDMWFELLSETLRTRKGTPEELWEALKAAQRGKRRFDQTAEYYKLVFSFTFPRLDSHVTTTMNHLLKSPFSYHPKSGFISVPIPPSQWEYLPQTWAPALKPLLAGDPEAKRAFNESVEQFRSFVGQTVNEGTVQSPWYPKRNKLGSE